MDNNKLLAFEYFLCELMEWNIQSKNLKDFDYNNDLSILKSLKILFFTVALDAKSENSLLNVFDKFYAMPLGPVELDIYNAAKDNGFRYFTLDRKGLTAKEEWKNIKSVLIELLGNLTLKITEAVSNLKSNAFSFIEEDAFDLVELSHTYNSWISSFNSTYSNIAFMNPSLIKEDFVNLEIQTF